MSFHYVARIAENGGYEVGGFWPNDVIPFAIHSGHQLGDVAFHEGLPILGDSSDEKSFRKEFLRSFEVRYWRYGTRKGG